MAAKYQLQKYCPYQLTINRSPFTVKKMPTIPTTTLQLDIPLRGKQIRNFRAAIIEATERKLPLLHNKDENGQSVNRYPQVQYRVRAGKAAAWAVGEGADQLRQWLFQSQGQLKMVGRTRSFRVVDWKDDRFDLKMLPRDKPQWYHLNRWLPLHKGKYEEWLQAPNLKTRIELMENQLASHIFAFARDMDWQLPEYMHINLQQIVHTRKVKLFGNPFVGFDIVFAANMALPPGIGLGHAVSHGYGIATPVKAFKSKAKSMDQALTQLVEKEVESI